MWSLFVIRHLYLNNIQQGSWFKTYIKKTCVGHSARNIHTGEGMRDHLKEKMTFYKVCISSPILKTETPICTIQNRQPNETIPPFDPIANCMWNWKWPHRYLMIALLGACTTNNFFIIMSSKTRPEIYWPLQSCGEWRPCNKESGGPCNTVAG